MLNGLFILKIETKSGRTRFLRFGSSRTGFCPHFLLAKVSNPTAEISWHLWLRDGIRNPDPQVWFGFCCAASQPEAAPWKPIIPAPHHDRSLSATIFVGDSAITACPPSSTCSSSFLQNQPSNRSLEPGRLSFFGEFQRPVWGIFSLVEEEEEGGGGIVRNRPFPVNRWTPNNDSESIAPQLFAFSLYSLTWALLPRNQVQVSPELTLFGFYFLLASVGVIRNLIP